MAREALISLEEFANRLAELRRRSRIAQSNQPHRLRRRPPFSLARRDRLPAARSRPPSDLRKRSTAFDEVRLAVGIAYGLQTARSDLSRGLAVEAFGLVLRPAELERLQFDELCRVSLFALRPHGQQLPEDGRCRNEPEIAAIE
jgi:hypothetical protein